MIGENSGCIAASRPVDTSPRLQTAWAHDCPLTRGPPEHDAAEAPAVIRVASYMGTASGRRAPVGTSTGLVNSLAVLAALAFDFTHSAPEVPVFLAAAIAELGLRAHPVAGRDTTARVGGAGSCPPCAGVVGPAGGSSDHRGVGLVGRVHRWHRGSVCSADSGNGRPRRRDDASGWRRISRATDTTYDGAARSCPIRYLTTSVAAAHDNDGPMRVCIAGRRWLGRRARMGSVPYSVAPAELSAL